MRKILLAATLCFSLPAFAQTPAVTDTTDSSGTVNGSTGRPTILLDTGATAINLTHTGGTVTGVLQVNITAPTANTTPFTISGYSLTGSDTHSMIQLLGTTNTSGVVDILKMNITNTGVGAGSNLINIQVGSILRMTLDYAGALAARSTITTGVAGSVQGQIIISGSTSGTHVFTVPVAASGTTTWPNGTTDFSSTGGTSQVVKQTSSGGAFTVGQLAFSDISGSATLAQFPTIATNTVLGNATSGTAVPTALTVGSCSTASSALIWTTNTGFGCNTSITANAVAVGGITGLGTGVATALAINTGSSGAFSRLIAAGSTALGTSAISSASCATAATGSASGTLTTDSIIVSFNADPTAVTGYVPLTTGMLVIMVYPTADTVNFKVCNNTSASITPGAITLNWRVVR